MRSQVIAILVAGAMIAAAIGLGIWYQDYNSPFNQCVRHQRSSSEAVRVFECLRLMNPPPR